MSRLVVGWTQHGSSSLADMLVVKAYPAAHGGVGSQEESLEHDFDTWYREAASRGEVEKEKQRAAETHEETNLSRFQKKTLDKKSPF